MASAAILGASITSIGAPDIVNGTFAGSASSGAFSNSCNYYILLFSSVFLSQLIFILTTPVCTYYPEDLKSIKPSYNSHHLSSCLPTLSTTCQGFLPFNFQRNPVPTPRSIHTKMVLFLFSSISRIYSWHLLLQGKIFSTCIRPNPMISIAILAILGASFCCCLNAQLTIQDFPAIPIPFQCLPIWL